MAGFARQAIVGVLTYPVKAAEGTGARIAWRVSSREAEEAPSLLFTRDPVTKGEIDVVDVPFKK